MFQEYEIVALILGLVALLVVLFNYKRLDSMPAKNILITGLGMFLISWFFTNLEAFIWSRIFNITEHISHSLGGVLLAVWCWRVFIRTEKR